MARALWITAPGRAELRDEQDRAPDSGEVTVRALFGGVSRGTEALWFSGRVPASERLRMRCPFQAGDPPDPVKYGYINVGLVEEVGAGGDPALLGRTVFCLYPHQDRYVVPATAITALPEGLPPERAVLAAHMETALNAAWDGAPSPGDRVAVVGGGPVGLLVAWLVARIPGAEVVLVDPLDQRRQIARDLGMQAVAPGEVPADRDLVFHASGTAAGLTQALAMAALEAPVVELSWFGTGEVGLPLGGAFHSQRLSLRSSQVSRIPASHQARWGFSRRMAKALDLLQDPVLDCLVGQDIPFSELPAALERLSAGPKGPPLWRVAYPGQATRSW